MSDHSYQQLRKQLDALALRGESYLKRYALREAIEAAAPGLLTALLIVPGVYFLAALIELLAGRSIWPFGIGATLALTLAVAVGWFVLRALLHYFRQPIDRRISLALFDRELGLKDRIQAADEFTAAETRSGFQQAAIEDASAYLQQALDAKLDPIVIAGPELNADRWKHAAAAAVVLLLAFVLHGSRFDRSNEDLPLDLETAVAQALVAADSPADAPLQRPEPPQAERQAATPRERKQAGRDQDAAEFTEALEAANTSSGNQASADQSGANGGASQQNRSDNAESSASGQGASSKKDSKPQDAAQRKPKKPRPRSEEDAEENNESSSGISGGKGSSSGSRTSSSDKQAVDNKAQRDDSDDDAYDDAEEEEDEEQEAASAARPLLNQRKAPVDRSLVPSGAGPTRENPRANGRGGPGGLKKTRGVAAMLLGVPMPDQLRGQANPGRMKVQRERAEPEEKFMADAAAAHRGAIGDSIGTIAHQGLAPWMQDLVRDYFLAQRESSTNQSE